MPHPCSKEPCIVPSCVIQLPRFPSPLSSGFPHVPCSSLLAVMYYWSYAFSCFYLHNKLSSISLVAYSPSLSLALYISISLSRSLSIPLSLYISLCLSLSLFLYISLSRSLFLSLSLSLSLSICLSPFYMRKLVTGFIFASTLY